MQAFFQEIFNRVSLLQHEDKVQCQKQKQVSEIYSKSNLKDQQITWYQLSDALFERYTSFLKLSKTNKRVLFNPQQILERKSTLFSIVVAGVIGILAAPIILPHLFHGFHIAHIGLHIGGVTLAVFLSILSIMAFLRLRTKRLLFTAIAFSVFIAAETVLMVDATWPILYDLEYMSLLEIGHSLTFVTLGLLALGVFRND